MKKKIIERLFGAIKSRETQEMEYLNRSVSLYDLERRQNEIARGLFR